MFIAVRREPCGARSTPSWQINAPAAGAAALFGLATVLSGCQSTAVVPADSDGIEQTAPAASPPPQARFPAAVTPAVPRPISQEPAAASSPGPMDTIARIGNGLALPPEENAAIDRELDWYVSNADYLSLVLNRSERYLYHIVKALEQHRMPVDLALLPIVESAYDPFAYSRGQAAGLWQIIPGTGRELGLKQNWWYDARRDVLESTEAALFYLRKLHERFDGDWLLAVAGYNAGGGSVARAIRRAQAAGATADFWGIGPYLPVETRTYVPKLLALGRLVAEPSRYGVSLPSIADEPHFRVIETGGQIDMALAAQIAGIGSDELYRLNPGVNRWATDPDGPHRLLIPVEKAEHLAAAVSRPGGLQGIRWTRHVVATGETLSHLALAYRTTTSVLRNANDLPGDMIRAGQGLMVPLPVDTSEEYAPLAGAGAASIGNRPGHGRQQAYAVQAGDSLWSLARRYGVEVADLARWNSMAPEDVLSIGRELVLWSNSPVAAPDANQRIRRIAYTVQNGDSLYRISTRFRVSVADLLQWNDLTPERYLQPGQRLVLYVDVTEQST